MTKKKKKNSRAARRRRQRRNRRIAIACLVVLLLAVGLFVFFTRGSGPDVLKDPVIAPDVTAAAEPEITDIPVTEQPTETPQPTNLPTATPQPEPTDTPYAGPTPEPTRSPAFITITATGDVTLGSGGIKNIRKFPQYYKENGYQYFFENVRDYFSEDDITIVNLEGPLTKSKDKRAGRTFNFKGDPEYVQILTYGSVELCNIANNHLLDYKEAGFKDTVKALQDAGIGVSGGIDNQEIEYYTEVNGYTVGSLGFTEWNFKPEYILKTTAAAKEKCDLLIVSMHWNEEGKKQLSSFCKKISEKLIDAGADIVIGNHTHCVGEISMYKGKYIINSLGNFCFGGNDILWNYETDVFRQRFLLTGDGKVIDAGIDLKPALNYTTMERRKNNFKPGWPDDALGLEILKTVAGYSKNLDMNQVLWLTNSYVAEKGLQTQFGGTVLDEMSADEFAASYTVVSGQPEENDIEFDS